MAKLVCTFSFLTLCVLNHFDYAQDMGGATLRLAIALVFAGALLVVAHKELEEFIG